MTYGLGDILTNQVNEQSNQKIKLTIDSKANKEIEIDFKFDEENLQLIDNIEIIANEDTKATVILKYEKGLIYFKNLSLKPLSTKFSASNIIIIITLGIINVRLFLTKNATIIPTK